MECAAQCCCHRTPIAEFPCTGSSTVAVAIVCFSSDAYVIERELQLFPLTRAVFALWRRVCISFIISLQVLLKSDHALSHAMFLGTEKLWISQVNYTLGVTISMLNSMSFYFIRYLLVPVFREMENRNGKVNGRTKVCICYLLCSHPKHWV